MAKEGFTHLTVTAESHRCPCFTVCAETVNLPTHTALAGQPQLVTTSQIVKKLVHLQTRVFCENI